MNLVPAKVLKRGSEYNMAENEITIIEPSRLLKSLDLRDMWRHRELLYFLTLRDVKLRYKQTAIGVLWVILQPVITTAIFTVLFSNFARFDTRDVPYPLFALSGLMIWLFVHTSITMASNSFVSNTNLVTKVYFPRLIVPFAATLAGITDLFFSLLLLAIMMVYYGAVPHLQILLAPVFLILAVIQTMAFGTLFAALNVRFRDVKFALPFALQVWMIVSPIFYPATMLSEKWRLVFAINPLVGILEGFRASLFGQPFDWRTIGVSCASIVVLVLLSLFIFKRMEDDFADLI
jgi:lipopolysaccharide transport system permease protein